MTFEEIKEFIQTANCQGSLFSWDKYDLKLAIRAYFEEEGEDAEFTEGQIKLVFDPDNNIKVAGKQNTDEFWVVRYFKDQDIYIQLTGEYDSYGECEHEYHNEVKRVYPVEKIVTFYE